VNIHCVENFLTGHDLSNFRLTLKTQSCPELFRCSECIFYYWGFLSNCTCLENRVALKIFTVLNILFTFWSFEQLARALKNKAALKFFKPGGRGAADPPSRTPMIASQSNGNPAFTVRAVCYCACFQSCDETYKIWCLRNFLRFDDLTNFMLTWI